MSFLNTELELIFHGFSCLEEELISKEVIVDLHSALSSPRPPSLHGHGVARGLIALRTIGPT